MKNCRKKIDQYAGQVETAETADGFFCLRFPRFRLYLKTRKPRKIMKYIKYWGFNFYLPFLYIQMPQINVYTVSHSTPYPKGPRLVPLQYFWIFCTFRVFDLTRKRGNRGQKKPSAVSAVSTWPNM